MYRKKKNSRTLEKASTRYDGIQSIDSKLDVGSGFSAPGYLKTIAQLRNDISAYNTALSKIDDLHNKLSDTEKTLAEYSERMLLGVAARYGKDSSEYEMAGGVRKRDRKKPKRKVAVTAS
ncbi:MAG: hypothetical protein WA949_00200 [Phormidesmis sp.]